MATSTSFDGTPSSPHTSPPRNPRERVKSFSVGDLRALGRGTAITLKASKDLWRSFSNVEIECTDNPEGHLVPNMPLSPTIEKADGHRIIIVANRLNCTAKRGEDGKVSFQSSSGGLATGLAGVQKVMKCLYYGWLGLDVPPEEREDVSKRALEEYGATPIWVSEQLMDLHYNGFSNSILWALLHYHPEGISFDDTTWEAYKEVNQIFAKVVAENVQDGDVVWIHDYHLMLCPSILRSELEKRELDNVKIGFFLHTPWPSSEIYRVLPVREEILEGLLQSDLLGFQTIDYARHFLNSCSKVLHLATTPAGVYYQGKFVAVQDFPIGIDVDQFTNTLKEDAVIKRIDHLKKHFEGVKVIVGVDRLDYIKGMQQKMHAFEVFLAEHPEWVGKVVLVQYAIPTRGDVEEYQNLRATVNELVSRINGKYGTTEFTPIRFLHQTIPPPMLTALYAAGDVMLVTSTRDGMNLVSYEYIACQAERHGVMILSEFAGAAQSLNGSLIVNPWDTDNVAKALHDAVTMGEEERKEKYKQLHKRVNKFTSRWWGEAFVSEIMRISKGMAKLELSGREKQGSEESEAMSSGVMSSGVISSGSEFAVEVMTPSNFDVTDTNLAQLPELERCPKKDVAGHGRFREDEDGYNERYAELHQDDEGFIMMAPKRSPPPHAG